MKLKLLTPLLLILSLLSSPSWSDPFSPIDESMELDELVKREGIYYKKFTEVPFTGEIDINGGGRNYYIKGSMKSGMKEGAWICYYWDGQLLFKGNYKNGKKVGAWVYYDIDGNLNKVWSGNYKNGMNLGRID